MKKMLFSLILLPALVSAMDYQQQQDVTANEPESREFLVHVYYDPAARGYLEGVEKPKTTDEREFAELMKEGKTKFPGTETSIKTFSRGVLFLIKPERPVKVGEFLAHYDTNRFVYKIKMGRNEIEAYKKQVMEEDAKTIITMHNFLHLHSPDCIII